jgi:DNA (cytosine-5)-methyltransferase 1
VWRCPNTTCRGGVVHPGVLPAAVAIDWTLPAGRIGDRSRPLAPKTLARIEAGLRRYAGQTPTGKGAAAFLAPLRSGRPRTQPVTSPLSTVVADGSNHALGDPLLVPAGGTWNTAARPVTQPCSTRTGRDADALVVPLRRNGVARPAGSGPLATVAAAGNHHALVMRNMTARGDQGQMCTPVTEPARTILAEARQSLIRWDHLLVSYYGTGVAHPVTTPMGTRTTLDRDGLLSAEVRVDDCTFRMLHPGEIAAAMAFDAGYVVLGNRREQVRQCGNAVTPPAARDLVASLVEAITGAAALGVA